MPTPKSAKERFQIDWMISNLRWLLLMSVALVNFTDALIGHSDALESLDPFHFLPQIILLVIAALYNLAVMLLLSYGPFRRAVPVMTLVIDTVLSIGFVLTSGGLTSPLLFFALFPIITAALRFHWTISLLVAGFIVVGCGSVGYAMSMSWSDLLSFGASALVLLLATLVSSLVGDRVNKTIAQRRRLEEEAELRKLRAAQEHSQVIFELASTLSATLNYNAVLKSVLEVGEAGMNELGRPGAAHVSMVLLFGQSDLRVVASRHLSPHDQNVTLPGREGVLDRVLNTAETVVVDNPAADPELGQIIMMHSCRQAIAVPLRAGFENYGAVIFGSAQHDTYTDDHKELLTAICNQAIVALQNAQLYQSLMEEKERIVEVEEDQRKKLARKLHDGPTQSIAAVAMRLNYARTLLKKQQNAQQVVEELARTEELARRTTKEIRHMLFTLRPLILETQGLKAALEQYVSKLTETDPAMSIHLEAMTEIDDALDRNAQGVVFYIVDEAIGNARKYAKDANVWVRLLIQDGTFIAEVEDDGPGFDVEEIQGCYDERGSLGLVNMYERAELVGGKLIISSAPGEGTRITLTVPVRRR